MDKSTVSLRPFRSEDLGALERYAVDPDVLGTYQWRGFSDVHEFRARWAEDTFPRRAPFRLVVDEQGTAAGAVSWHSPEDRRQEAGLPGWCRNIGGAGSGRLPPAAAGLPVCEHARSST
ncbi:MAG TPA: hypothetical protein VMY88_00230 [Acidimicrobiales bacterium]|nr:hypothetical protein [Acidimicrobiales bacterium]